MNGPQHYAAAEACLRRASELDPADLSTEAAQYQLLKALAHAALAVAAATAMPVKTLTPLRDLTAWHTAVSGEEVGADARS